MHVLRRLIIKKLFETKSVVSTNIFLFTQPSKLVKNLAGNTAELASNTDDFKTIYRLPTIQFCTIVNRLKFDVTILAGVVTPASFVYSQLYNEGIVVIHIFGALCGFGCLALHTLGFLCNKIIGAMYISSDSTLVKISYCNYWGRRKDLVVPVNDVVPLSELQDKITDPYIIFRRYSSTETLKLSLRFGSVLDAENLRKVLGHPE